MPKREVVLKESVIEDLKSLGKPVSRKVLKEASHILAADPRQKHGT